MKNIKIKFWSNPNDYYHNLTIWKPTFSKKNFIMKLRVL